MGQPECERPKSEEVELNAAVSASTCGQGGPMEPRPEVAEEHRDGDEQEPKGWSARGGADAGLVHLAVAGFDTESAAVGTIDSGRVHADAAASVEEGAVAAAVGAAAAENAQVDGDASLAVRLPGILGPTGFGVRPTRPEAGEWAVVWSLPVDGLRHNERLAGGLEIADDTGGGEPAIEQEKTGRNAGGDDPLAKFADDHDHGEGEAATGP